MDVLLLIKDRFKAKSEAQNSSWSTFAASMSASLSSYESQATSIQSVGKNGVHATLIPRSASGPSRHP
jgi:hypothetical protein